MPSRFSLAAWLLLLAAPVGCGSVTGSGDDDDTPSDDAVDDDDGDPGDASDDPGDDAEDDGGDAGDDGGVPVDPTCAGASGTRLRQHVRRHSDGSSTAVGLLRDTALGVDCEFAQAGDGSLRCLPAISGPPVGGFAQGRQVFAAADCTVPMLESFNESETGLPLYIQDFDYDFTQSCAAPRRRYYEMGADLRIEPGATLYARAVSGCFPFPAQTNARYHVIVRELPETTFVAATAAPSDTGRLGVNVIETEDGARVCGDQDFLEDDQLGRCLPAPDEDGQLRCLPGTTEVRQATLEPCEGTPFGVAIFQQCDLDALAKEPVSTCGGGGYRVRELAATLPGPLYEDETCDLIEGEDSGYQLRRLGDALDPSGFVPLGLGRIRVGERLDRLASTTESGLVIGTERWFDRELGVECGFRTFGDSTRRCVPSVGLGSGVANASSLYSDPGCSAEVVVAAPFGCEPGGPAPLVAYHERGDGGGGEGPVERLLYEVGARHEGPLYRLGDACEPVGADEVLYGVGAEIPVESLVTVVDDDQIE